MATYLFYLFILISFSLTHSCDVFTGMTCTCYEPVDLRCTMSKLTPLSLSPSSISSSKKFHSIDLTFDVNEMIKLDANWFTAVNQLLPTTTRNSLSIILRFQNFQSFLGKASSFAHIFQGITSPHKRLTIELHPLKPKTITFDANAFDKLQINELSLYAESLSSPFEAIFNNTNITHLNIEGAIVLHDPMLLKDFTGRIDSLKVTRMADTVNSEEFPPFPVQSYTIEAHKMRFLNGPSFTNYKQLTGLNIIEPDVSITPKILNGLENLPNLKSISFDADRIAEGALKHVRQIETLILGAHLKILDPESLNALKSLKQLDARYVQFSTLQGNTSCPLADFINRRRMTGLTVYLPEENPDCDCVLVFLNNMVDDGSQLAKCQSTHSDRCLFSSCSIVSEYFNRKQREDLEQQGSIIEDRPPVNTPAQAASSSVPFIPPSIDFNDHDPSYYPDENALPNIEPAVSTTQRPIEPNVYDDEGTGEIVTPRINPPYEPPSRSPFINEPQEFENEFSTPVMRRVNADPKKYRAQKHFVVPWIPFAVIASCLFLSLVIAMVSYIIYHKRRSVSFKLVPQAAPII